jgi:hypothetical protein
MLSLPIELLEHVLEQLAQLDGSTTSLRSSALASRSMCHLSRRLLFRQLTIPNYEDRRARDIWPVRLLFFIIHSQISNLVTEILIHTTTVDDLWCFETIQDITNIFPLVFPRIRVMAVRDEEYLPIYGLWQLGLAPFLQELHALDAKLHSVGPAAIVYSDTWNIAITKLTVSTMESAHMTKLIEALSRSRSQYTLQTATIELARDVRPKCLQRVVVCLASFVNLVDLEIGIFLVNNLDMLQFHSEEQLWSVMSAPNSRKMYLPTYSIGSCVALKNLLISVIGNTSTVPLLRSLIAQASLPELDDLTIMINVIDDADEPRADFQPYGDVDERSTYAISNMPIISLETERTITSLTLSFSSSTQDIYVHSSSLFLPLFGDGRKLKTEHDSDGNLHWLA